MKSLAIIVTHPIQYYIPVYQQLAKTCRLKVFYTWGEQGAASKYDPDFQKTISWDIPLLDGYLYEFVKNSAKNPGSHHYKGIVNPDLINLLKAFQPDAILIYGWAYQSHLAVMRYFKSKIPIWFRGDSTLLDGTSTMRKMLRKVFLTWVYKHVDIAFLAGTANHEYFKAYGLKKNQLVFAPHAVDNNRFATDRSSEALKLRQNLGISVSDTLILFAGKLEEKKDPLLLLQAFVEIDQQSPQNEQRSTKNLQQTTKNEKRLTNNDQPKTTNDQPKTSNTHLLFVGNGALEETLKAQTLQHKKQNVHFLDFQNQSQMPVIYQACNLFCLPSRGPGETWGLAVNEAMAAGKAIFVSNRVGCAGDLISGGLNGEVFNAGDLVDLKNKLQKLLLDPAHLHQMGEESKEIIEHWTFEHQVETFAKTLNEGH
ncbi:glycosyltransferase [Pedobacter petrophilus]|uniref:Glycosyltransferase n=1 Tax=Pedobacter petrophilus TaxID=1908241 RepID=A0A7K0FW27_9SPHI|nr:glycosyltransferase family 4 protein [Pedobacter petrophilus]MRX75631.1 glycosyltransferase [Pedobacter petrophilus]